MQAIIAIVIAVLLVIAEAIMPKPRSRLPAIVILIAIVVVLAIAFLQWQEPELIPEKYIIWILVASAIIPIAFYVFTVQREKLTTVLSKLDDDSKQRLENIIGILQQVYFNEKTMVETLSTTISKDKVETMNSEINKTSGFRLSGYLQAHEGEYSLIEKIKLVMFTVWDIIILTIIAFSRLFPYFIREMRFLEASTIPDTLEIGLNNARNIDDNFDKLLKTLEVQLQDATKWIRTDNSINVIQKCLRYSHATNNLYLVKLLNADKTNISNKLKRYAELTRGNYGHLMSQRFAEVASVLSRELGG